MRFSTIRPTTSARQTAAATATDAAAQGVRDFNPDTAINANLTRFNQQLDTPDVGFQSVGTDVARRGVDPTVGYQGVDTDVNRRAVDPKVGYRAVDTDITRKAVNPEVGYEGVDTRVNRRAVDPTVGFNGVQTDVDAGPDVAPTDSAELAKARGYQMNAADAIAKGPNRRSIAEDSLSAFDTRAQPGIQKQMREVGQRAASMGRIGMGATAIETLEPFTNYLTERAALSKDLAAETAAGDISDRRNNLSDFRGLTESTSGLDASRRGEQRTERSNVQDITGQNLARRTGERDTALGLSERNTGRAMDESAADVGVDSANIARTMAERDARTSLGERNTGRAMDESAADAAIASENVGRRMDERNMQTGLEERNTGRDINESAADYDAGAANIGRRMAERDTRTALAERNTGRDMDESAADYAAGVGNVNRRSDERNAGVANAQQNASRRAAARATALSAGINAADLTGSTRRSNLSSLSGVENDIDSRGRLDRGETRGERQYQSDTSRQAVEDAIRQHLIEQQDGNTDFEQQLALLRATGGDTSALINGSNRSGRSAAEDYEAMRKLLGQSYMPR